MAVRRRAKPGRKTADGKAVDHADIATLNDRQQLFVRAYLDTMNGTRAALAAGYSQKCAGQRASVMLRQPKIRAAVDAGLQERAMGKDEVLARLSDIGRFDLTIYANGEGDVELAEAARLGLLRFVKKVVRTERVLRTDGDTGEVTVEKQTRLEFHDAQAALGKLGEFHKLFGQRLEHTGPNGTPLFEKGCIRVVVGGSDAE